MELHLLKFLGFDHSVPSFERQYNAKQFDLLHAAIKPSPDIRVAIVTNDNVCSEVDIIV